MIGRSPCVDSQRVVATLPNVVERVRDRRLQQRHQHAFARVVVDRLLEHARELALASHAVLRVARVDEQNLRGLRVLEAVEPDGVVNLL